ncbi:MAG: DUF1588 domain-containing protein [Alphaproteobacteria bacterium]|nr:DUF1588 domain-containing protein [Alphaproteobacteria bacterium]
MIWLLALLACDDPDPVEITENTLVSLEAPRLARRMSLDLRGVLPSPEELAQVEADPGALDALRDEWLEDPRLEQRLVHALGERWHTRVDDFLLIYREYPALADDPTVAYAFKRAVGEEPLRLMARIAVDGRSWDEVVTADTTMAEDILLSIWPVEAIEEGAGWREARYTDGRPAAGVLATNGLWWRYESTVTNYNRARAAALVKLLVCADIASRPVSFAELPALVDEESTRRALRETPACVNCHSTVDPIASTLFGFWAANEHNSFEIDTYHREREAQGMDLMGVEAHWFGVPVRDLADLGQAITLDSRFPACAVEGFVEPLLRRPVEDEFAEIEALVEVFEANGRRVKPLLAAITDTPAYRAGGLGPDADAATAERERTRRLLTAPLLASALGEAAGLAWTAEGTELLDEDTEGFRILAGGVDGVYVTAPPPEPNTSWLLVVQRAAQLAARDAYSAARAGQAPPLLDGINFADEVEAVSAELRWRLTALHPDAETLAADRALWEQVEALAGEDEAWVALLWALLQDPEFTSY